VQKFENYYLYIIKTLVLKMDNSQSEKTWEEIYIKSIIPKLTCVDYFGQHVIFLRGISGSGKSTVCEVLARLLGQEKVVYCSADTYFTCGKLYLFEPDKLHKAHKACVDSMEMALLTPGVSYVIVDNTHTQLIHLSAAEAIAEKYRAKMFYLEIVVPDINHLLICLKRQCHRVPVNVLLDQWLKWETHLHTTFRIPMFISNEEKLMLSSIAERHMKT
jgi:predicted kinase